MSDVGHGSVHASGAAVSDWRYWITYAGKVSADTEAEAKQAAIEDADWKPYPTIEVEVEEVGEGE